MTAAECDKDAHIRRYAALAAAGRPLFDAGPSDDGILVERPACWACGMPVRVSRWTLHTFVSRPFDHGVEKETYCRPCFDEYGWPEPLWEGE